MRPQEASVTIESSIQLNGKTNLSNISNNKDNNIDENNYNDNSDIDIMTPLIDSRNRNKHRKINKMVDQARKS